MLNLVTRYSTLQSRLAPLVNLCQVVVPFDFQRSSPEKRAYGKLLSMGYKDRFSPKGEHGKKAPTIERGRRLISLSETTGRCDTCKRVFAAKSGDAAEKLTRAV